MFGTNLSSTEDSMQSDSSYSREIPIQKDIWFAKDTVRYEDYLGDVSQEAERIRSGYYLDIQESLDTCLRYYDDMENPFYKVHIGAVKYLNYWKYQSRKQSKYFIDDSSSEYSKSDTSPDTLKPEALSKATGESITKKRTGRKRLDSDSMSGIGLLSSSSSANSTINGLEDLLLEPEHMDNVLNELLRMTPEELSRLINTPSPRSNDNNVKNECPNELLCFETMHPSSPEVESTDSKASTTISTQEMSAAAALWYMNKRSYTRQVNTCNNSNNSSDVPEDIYKYKEQPPPAKFRLNSSTARILFK